MLEELRPFVDDWHTHRPAPRAIVNLPTPLSPAPEGLLCSIGIHPWEADTASPALLAAIEVRAADDPAIVAIGEVGLDRRRGPSLDIQTPVFEAQARIAERTGLPLIIHAVRTIPEVLALHKKLQPEVPWIFHGFRGGPDAVRQILGRPGTFISLGPEPRSEILSLIPPDRLLRESDAQPHAPTLPDAHL